MQILQTKIPTTEKENVKAVAVTKFPLYNESDFSTNPTIEYALVTGENFVDFWR
jgi:hypothetical protein